MKNWSLLTLVGADQAGIVAKVTQALAVADCELGETSMMRMGGNFSMMLRVCHEDQELRALLKNVCEELNLHLHIDKDVEKTLGDLPEVKEPDVNITVYGADRSGIVSDVIGALSDVGLNIIDLEAAIGGTKEKPIYIMTIEGQALQGVDILNEAAKKISDSVELNIVPIQTLRA